jgi:hypothetical protein
MPNPEHIDVNVDEAVKFGVFANAFRVVEEAGPDCFLDFMVYSAAENEATVVARVRVRRDFLEGIRSKIGDAVVTFSDASQDAAAPPIAYRKAKEPVH